MKKIITYLIDHPKISNLLLIFIFLLALVGIFRVQRQAYPRVDFQKLRVTTYYPDALPKDVELNVTIPLEEVLKPLTGIKEYRSTSQEGVSQITVVIDPEAEDEEKVKSEVKRAIEAVPDLPKEITSKPFVKELKIDNQSIYEIAFLSKGDENDDQNISRLIPHLKELKRSLETLPDVSQIAEYGVPEKEIQIRLHKKNMIQHGVTMNDVIGGIRKNHLRISGGNLEENRIQKGISLDSYLDDPEDISNMIIVANDLGHRVRVKDIGDVSLDYKKQERILKYLDKDDGAAQEGIGLSIVKKGTSDIMQTIANVEKVLSDYKDRVSDQTIKIFSSYDRSIETRERLDIVTSNTLLGFLLVLAALFFFLDVRTAFWTAVGIPISIAITLSIVPYLDITINSISLLGFIIVIGMVVDDAIVIAESIYRFKEEGLNSREAALRGISRTIWPVVTTIITTIIAFIPIFFLPGIIGDFSYEIPAIVIIMLLASLFEASILLPFHLGYKSKEKTSAPEIKIRRMNRLGQNALNICESAYSKFLSIVLKKKYLSALALILFLCLGGFISYGLTSFNMFPANQAYKVWINGKVTTGSSLEATSEEVRKVESILNELPKPVVDHYRTEIGRRWGEQGLNKFSIRLFLDKSNLHVMNAEETKSFIISELKRKNLDHIHLDFYIETGGPSFGKPVEIDVTGNDSKKRLEILNRLKSDLQTLHAKEFDIDYTLGKEELKLTPNYDKLALSKLDMLTLASTIKAAYSGHVVAYLHEPEEKIGLRVMLDEKSKSSGSPLKDIYIKSAFGGLVPIQELVRVERVKSPENIFHFNGDRTNQIKADIDLSKITHKEIYQKMKSKYANFHEEYPEFNLSIGGEAKKSSQTFFHLITLIALAVLAIYAVLILQFNSFLQPIMVIMAIPFGVVGITLAFGLHNMEVSMLAMLGILGFSGVVVNDSLIMVDYINKLKPKGDARRKKISKEERSGFIIEGAILRFRPIVLTSITTILGLIPTAYGFIGGIDSFISPMVFAVSWGLFIGTISVLFVIPILYSVMER